MKRADYKQKLTVQSNTVIEDVKIIENITFGHNCIFQANTKFKDCTFGSGCIFGSSCIFKGYNTFGKDCVFGSTCWFDDGVKNDGEDESFSLICGYDVYQADEKELASFGYGCYASCLGVIGNGEKIKEIYEHE